MDSGGSIRFDVNDVNLYRYVGNNVIRWTDPLGLQNGEKRNKQCPEKDYEQITEDTLKGGLVGGVGAIPFSFSNPLGVGAGALSGGVFGGLTSKGQAPEGAPSKGKDRKRKTVR